MNRKACKIITASLSLIVYSFCISCREGTSEDPLTVLPMPKQVNYQKGTLCFENQISIYAFSPAATSLIEVLREDLRLTHNLSVIQSDTSVNTDLVLMLDSSMQDDEYHIEVASNIQLQAGSYQSLAMASVTLLQEMETNDQRRTCIRQMSLRDKPDLAYRGLLLDVARRKHDFSNLKEVVRLCRWSKVNYLQLHLTDEQNFTFPTKAYPQLVTKEYHFTESQLRELVEYAYVRGVEIVPELEVPGHALKMVENMPDVFGFEEKSINRSTINMARDTVYSVLDTLIGEIAEIFTKSRYIHIGGDEANFSGMEETQEVKQFLIDNSLKSIDELYWFFLNRMNSFVRKRNRQTIVWEGFSKEGNKVVDKNIIVMAWETVYQHPQDLLSGGYKIINVSWQPLYVVNHRKWSPAEIYQWNPYYWQNWVTFMPSFKPIQLEADQDVIGGSMASWDQPEYTEISSLRKRLPPMVENIWNVKRANKSPDFLSLLDSLDGKLSRYLGNVAISTAGLTFPDEKDGRYDEQTWFDSSVTVSFSPSPNYQIRYTLNDSPVQKTSSLYNSELKITKTTTLRYQLYDEKKNPLGNASIMYFEHRPVDIIYEGKHPINPDSLWYTTRDWLIPYSDSLKISPVARMSGELRYSISKDNGRSVWKSYQSPIVISDTNVIKVEAALFQNKKQIGSTVTRYFRKE